eukprot:Selendium_serpulae@DN2621_c0_g1_i2.p1
MFRKFAWGQQDKDGGASYDSGKKYPIRYQEFLDEKLYYSIPVLETTFSGKSSFQDLKILETEHFGKCLVMDNLMQSAESDEAVYHESLVQPAMLAHKSPKRVFVGGGAEGSTVREILRHKSVEKVVMVDLDEKAVEICKEHLHEWNAKVWTDPRVTVVYDDAKKYLQDNRQEKFDVVIMDICDPIEEGPGWTLYTKEFYESIVEHNLTSGGVFCTQSTACSVNLVTECFTVINKTLNTVFKHVEPYRTDVPSFGCPWAFHICSNEPIIKAGTDPVRLIAAYRYL